MVQKERPVRSYGKNRASAAATLAQHGRGARGIDRSIDFIDIEKRARRVAKGLIGKRRQTVYDAVRGQNHQRRAVHIYERHHGELIRCHGAPFSRGGIRRPLFVAIIQRGFITMVAVGND